jgi:hypothetical protein
MDARTVVLSKGAHKRRNSDKLATASCFSSSRLPSPPLSSSRLLSLRAAGLAFGEAARGRRVGAASHAAAVIVVAAAAREAPRAGCRSGHLARARRTLTGATRRPASGTVLSAAYFLKCAVAGPAERRIGARAAPAAGDAAAPAERRAAAPPGARRAAGCRPELARAALDRRARRAARHGAAARLPRLAPCLAVPLCHDGARASSGAAACLRSPHRPPGRPRSTSTSWSSGSSSRFRLCSAMSSATAQPGRRARPARSRARVCRRNAALYAR